MQVMPYLFITDGKCEEALKFYKSLFGGEYDEPMRWKDGPDMGNPPEMGNRIMHAEFKSPSIRFQASDARPTTTYGEGTISLSVNTDDEGEAKRVWDALTIGGKVEMPLEKQFWGAMFGMLTDRFGIDWMVNCQLPQ